MIILNITTSNFHKFVGQAIPDDCLKYMVSMGVGFQSLTQTELMAVIVWSMFSKKGQVKFPALHGLPFNGHGCHGQYGTGEREVIHKV